MTVLRKGLAAMAAAAPVLIAAGAAPALAVTAQHGGEASPDVIPCCGESGHYVTWKSTIAGTYLEVEHAGLSNGDDIDVYKKNGSCEYHGTTDTNCNEVWDEIAISATHNGYDEFAYINANSGLCLAGGSDKVGAADYQYSCGDYPTTRRYIYPNDNLHAQSVQYNYTLENVANNLYACKEDGGAIVYLDSGVTVTSAYLFPSAGTDCWWE
jgi:hypothetical protein